MIEKRTRTVAKFRQCLIPILAAVSVSVATGTTLASEYYVRGSAGLDWPDEAVFSDQDCLKTSPAALYGCGLGGDGAPLRSIGDFDTAIPLEVALGYAVAPAARIELQLGYYRRSDFDGIANFLEPGQQQSVNSDLSSMTAMLAAQFDLTGLGLPMMGPFVPFAGAGVGVSRTKTGETRMTFPRTITIVPGGRQTDAAWMLAAGLSMALGDRTVLDLAWRYTDIGKARTGESGGLVVWQDGSREPIRLDLAATQAKFRSHGLRLSLRYGF